MWYLYMLLCDQKTYYVGITSDLGNRFHQHKTKTSFFTKKFSDIQFVYCEEYGSKKEAVRRETQLKGWSHVKKQMLVDGKLGNHTCTEFAVAFLQGENHVSLP